MTTLFTSVFPIVASSLMNFEHHRSESSRQKWLFIKASLFNVLMTAVLITLINLFVATLDPQGRQHSWSYYCCLRAIFSQIGLSPVLQMLDIAGFVSRHIQAPRAKTQEEMNMMMLGTQDNLAERYANMIKFLFLVL
jgi:hypothetical protein